MRQRPSSPTAHRLHASVTIGFLGHSTWCLRPVCAPPTTDDRRPEHQRAPASTSEHQRAPARTSEHQRDQNVVSYAAWPHFGCACLCMHMHARACMCMCVPPSPPRGRSPHAAEPLREVALRRHTTATRDGGELSVRLSAATTRSNLGRFSVGSKPYLGRMWAECPGLESGSDPG